MTAKRDRAEAEVEAVLRDRYDLTDPGADADIQTAYRARAGEARLSQLEG